MSEVEWREVVGHPGYWVSNEGQVKDSTGVVLPTYRIKAGYLVVHMGKTGSRLIHHIVLESFIGPRPRHMVSRHLDDNKANNSLSNLVWGTHAENVIDRNRNQRMGRVKYAGLNEEKVKKILTQDKKKTVRELAKEYGVTVRSIYLVLHRETWEWVQ